MHSRRDETTLLLNIVTETAFLSGVNSGGCAVCPSKVAVTTSRSTVWMMALLMDSAGCGNPRGVYKLYVLYVALVDKLASSA